MTEEKEQEQELCEEVVEAVVYYKDKIRQIIMTNEDAILVKEILPEASVWLDHEVNIRKAVESMKGVEDVLRRLAMRGLFLDHFNKSDRSPTWHIKGKNVNIRFCPDWATETSGAACKLVKVGEDVIPRYKLVCDDQDK